MGGAWQSQLSPRAKTQGSHRGIVVGDGSVRLYLMMFHVKEAVRLERDRDRRRLNVHGASHQGRFSFLRLND